MSNLLPTDLARCLVRTHFPTRLPLLKEAEFVERAENAIWHLLYALWYGHSHRFDLDVLIPMDEYLTLWLRKTWTEGECIHGSVQVGNCEGYEVAGCRYLQHLDGTISLTSHRCMESPEELCWCTLCPEPLPRH